MERRREVEREVPRWRQRELGRRGGAGKEGGRAWGRDTAQSHLRRLAGLPPCKLRTHNSLSHSACSLSCVSCFPKIPPTACFQQLHAMCCFHRPPTPPTSSAWE